MDMEDVQYTRLKAEFIHCKNTLRRSINAAKRLYYLRTFASIEMTLNKLGL